MDREQQLAELVTQYSLALHDADTLLIMGQDPFTGFAHKLEAAAQQQGAKVIFELDNLRKRRALIENGTEQQFVAERARLEKLHEQITACVCIKARADPGYLAGVDPDRKKEFLSTVSWPFYRTIESQKKWNAVVYPCRSLAESAGTSLSACEDLVYRAAFIDGRSTQESIAAWEAMKDNMGRYKAALDGAEEVRIVVPGKTDVTFSLVGRGADISAGDKNMPGGEFYYGPVEDSMNGYVTFDIPAIYAGHVFSHVHLHIVEGKVVCGTVAGDNTHFADFLAIEGADVVGEYGNGCHELITESTGLVTIDEKMAQTFHFALGNSYSLPLDRGGGLNRSSVHLDLIGYLKPYKDQPGGELYVNNQLVQKDGTWLV